MAVRTDGIGDPRTDPDPLIARASNLLEKLGWNGAWHRNEEDKIPPLDRITCRSIMECLEGIDALASSKTKAERESARASSRLSASRDELNALLDLYEKVAS